MYKVIWDIETNGVILTDKNVDSKHILLPRPVFFEELDLLGFDKHWQYPKTQEPLLWANGRRYYYKGEWVVEAKGGNIFEPPQIIITENGKNLTLKPIDIDTIVKKNQEALFVLENEAIDFVEHTYKSYKKGRNKVDCFAVSFSGGKDSQVVLDIVSRVIPPDEYIVVFTDTDMELPSTYETVENTRDYYKKLYPELRFETAESRLSSEESWRKFGPPSRIHRWCCTVHKTAPYMRLLNYRLNGKRQPQILTFEGVRADESTKRNTYKRISKGEKHKNQINAEVIKYWNVTEVFLYIFSRSLLLNDGYRYGLNRVGCSICPFGSQWSEYIIGQKYPHVSDKYIKVLNEYIGRLNIKENNEINEFISKGFWKKKPGWEGVNANGTRIDFISSDNFLKAVMLNPLENFLEWSKTIGDLLYKETKDMVHGEIKVKKEVLKFDFKKGKSPILLEITGFDKDIILKNKIERLLYKTTYCIHCGACEVECPTGALRINPFVQIDTQLCAHCGNCLFHAEKGCFAAQSVKMIIGGNNMSRKPEGFTKYKTFGLRKEWLGSFLNKLDDWFANNNLGPIQIYAVIVWLRDAELLDKKDKKPTEFCRLLQKIFMKDELLVWEIIWINLSYNSNLIKWYVSDFIFGSAYSTAELVTIGLNKGFSNSKNTISSGVDALANMLETTPLGKDLNLGIIEKRGNIRYIKKIGTADIHPVAIAYSLYKYAQNRNRRDFTVSEFYREDQKEGPYRLFGISREKFENTLRYLQEDKNGVVKVELGKGLDNILLRDDLNCLEVLELLTQETVK